MALKVNPHVSAVTDRVRCDERGLRVYLGSPNNSVQADAVKDMPVLLSFAIAQNCTWLDQFIPTFDRLLLDCGAYTAHTQGQIIDGTAYRDWYQQFSGICDAYAGIDSIDGDWRTSWKNYEAFGGFPTMHDTDPPEFLQDVIALAAERNKWIGIGVCPPEIGERGGYDGFATRYRTGITSTGGRYGNMPTYGD